MGIREATLQVASEGLQGKGTAAQYYRLGASGHGGGPRREGQLRTRLNAGDSPPTIEGDGEDLETECHGVFALVRDLGPGRISGRDRDIPAEHRLDRRNIEFDHAAVPIFGRDSDLVRLEDFGDNEGIGVVIGEVAFDERIVAADIAFRKEVPDLQRNY